MKNTKAIIFDCFGVLYVDVTEAYFAHFPEKREELHDLNKLSDHGFISRQDYVRAVSKVTGESASTVEAAFRNEHVLNKPLVEFIRTHLKPRYKTGLLSNVGREWMQDFFDAHQLHELFDQVVLSGEEGITKPNPLIFERIAERLGEQGSDCLFIDNVAENCAGAEAVGMRSFLFKDTSSLIELLQ